MSASVTKAVIDHVVLCVRDGDLTKDQALRDLRDSDIEVDLHLERRLTKAEGYSELHALHQSYAATN